VSGTKWYKVVQSGTERYKVLQVLPEWYSVIQSGTKLYKVVQSSTECCKMAQSGAKWYKLSDTTLYKVAQSGAMWLYSVIQSGAKWYKVAQNGPVSQVGSGEPKRDRPPPTTPYPTLVGRISIYIYIYVCVRACSAWCTPWHILDAGFGTLRIVTDYFDLIWFCMIWFVYFSRHHWMLNKLNNGNGALLCIGRHQRGVHWHSGWCSGTYSKAKSQRPFWNT